MWIFGYIYSLLDLLVIIRSSFIRNKVSICEQIYRINQLLWLSIFLYELVCWWFWFICFICYCRWLVFAKSWRKVESQSNWYVRYHIIGVTVIAYFCTKLLHSLNYVSISNFLLQNLPLFVNISHQLQLDIRAIPVTFYNDITTYGTSRKRLKV